VNKEASLFDVRCSPLVYNGGLFLAHSIESLLAQTHHNIELVISDNASSDGTQAVCEQIARRDSRVCYFRLPNNIGGIKNHTKVRELARGEYFMWASSDDLWQPTYIARCVEVLQADPAVVLAYAINAKIDEDGRSLGTVTPGLTVDTDDVVQRFRDLTQIDSPIEPFYGVVRRSAMQAAAPLPQHPGWDRFVLAEIGLMGRFRQIKEPLYTRRIHSNQSVSNFPSLRERYRWGNPTARHRRCVWPYIEFASRFAAVAWRSAPDWRTKLGCLMHVLKWCNWQRRNIWGDVVGTVWQLWGRR
jgi:glycosyltransferase involved in cell wall biosynthesis